MQHKTDTTITYVQLFLHYILLVETVNLIAAFELERNLLLESCGRTKRDDLQHQTDAMIVCVEAYYFDYIPRGETLK